MNTRMVQFINIVYNLMSLKSRKINFSPNHNECFFGGKISSNFDLKIQFQPT
jgi:hypothetical protein